MKTTKILYVILSLAIVGLVMVACGGSGGVAGGGISGTGSHAARGVVVATNNLVVNGTTFDTAGATVFIDGYDSPSMSDIKEGMVVEVVGVDDNGSFSADTVATDEAVRGPVDEVLDANRMVVLGQLVIIDDATILDDSIAGTDLSGLGIGDIVEVYGAVGDAILASFVELKTPPFSDGFRYKVRGEIDTVNISLEELTINDLTVEYGTADLSDLLGGIPAEGQFVEVKLQTTPNGPNWVADKVEIDDIQLPNDFDGYVEIEGFVTATVTTGASFAPGDSFMIGSQEVVTLSGTEFEGGLPEELIVGSLVEAEGDLIGGVIQADKVEFKSGIRLESDVATNDGSKITLIGLPGISITANALTAFDGDGVIEPTTLDEVPLGAHVRIRGRLLPDVGTFIVADRLEAEEANVDRTDIDLQGPVDAVGDPEITILGIVVDTTGFDFANFQGIDDDGEGAIGRTEFFNRVDVGTLVKAQARIEGGPIEWREVQLEN